MKIRAALVEEGKMERHLRCCQQISLYSLHDYANVLVKKRQEVGANHAKLYPVRVDSDSQELVIYQPMQEVLPKLATKVTPALS